MGELLAARGRRWLGRRAGASAATRTPLPLTFTCSPLLFPAFHVGLTTAPLPSPAPAALVQGAMGEVWPPQPAGPCPRPLAG